MNKYNFKLKGTGEIEYHLGMSFRRNDRNELCISPQWYIKKMVDNYKRLFGKSPSHHSQSPLESNNHPEIDSSKFLGEDDVQKYQSLIGAMQWAISIGHFHIAVHVMTMSSFRASPRHGHLERVKCMVGYLSKFCFAELRILTDEPNFSDIEVAKYDWSKSVYGDASEAVPKDAPEPLGKPVTMSHYQDANLYHDIIAGQSVTAILHFLNKFPIDWYSKKQATVKTATYGSKYISARTCVNQIVDLRTTLRYLGIPIRDVSYMFGDNELVINSSTQPHSKLHKRFTPSNQELPESNPEVERFLIHVKRFHIESHFEMTESIGDYIFRTFYIFHCWSELFYDETPSHDALGIEVFMSKILMVCVDHNLLT
jgi:hypothetical protein